jgi:hypothetical protein
MPRDVFPHAADRDVIAMFLAGAGLFPIETDYLTASKSSLGVNGYTVAWFDTAGALCAKVPNGLDIQYCRRTINEIMRQLSVPERELTIEHGEWVSNDLREIRCFFDGSPVTHEAPFVLAGSLSMQAHQASTTTVGGVT